MNLGERVKKIGQYFVLFNVAPGDKTMIGYAVVNFPSEWNINEVIPIIREQFSVSVKLTDKGIYFISDMSDDGDKIFDAIEFVIEYYRSLEEKTKLYAKKTAELKEIFIKEDLETLKKLTFTFGDTPKINEAFKKPAKKEKDKDKSKEKIDLSELAAPADTKESSTEELVEEPTVEEANKEAVNVVVGGEAEDSSLMSLAKGLVGE